jgi:hypothetical protein
MYQQFSAEGFSLEIIFSMYLLFPRFQYIHMYYQIKNQNVTFGIQVTLFS